MSFRAQRGTPESFIPQEVVKDNGSRGSSSAKNAS
jgi:hypothetical protein